MKSLFKGKTRKEEKEKKLNNKKRKLFNKRNVILTSIVLLSSLMVSIGLIIANKSRYNNIVENNLPLQASNPSEKVKVENFKGNGFGNKMTQVLDVAYSTRDDEYIVVGENGTSGSKEAVINCYHTDGTFSWGMRFKGSKESYFVSAEYDSVNDRYIVGGTTQSDSLTTSYRYREETDGGVEYEDNNTDSFDTYYSEGGSGQGMVFAVSDGFVKWSAFIGNQTGLNWVEDVSTDGTYVYVAATIQGDVEVNGSFQDGQDHGSQDAVLVQLNASNGGMRNLYRVGTDYQNQGRVVQATSEGVMFAYTKRGRKKLWRRWGSNRRI